MNEIKSRLSRYELIGTIIMVGLIIATIVTGTINFSSSEHFYLGIIFFVFSSVMLSPIAINQIKILKKSRLYWKDNPKKAWSRDKMNNLIKKHNKKSPFKENAVKKWSIVSFTGVSLTVSLHLQTKNEEEKKEIVAYIKEYIQEQTGFEVTKVIISH